MNRNVILLTQFSQVY